MKQIWIVVLSVGMMGTLANSGLAQTTGTPDAQTKQEAKTQKAQAKSDREEKKTAAQKGKKTTTQQDAAYALAYKNQAPEGHAPAPK